MPRELDLYRPGDFQPYPGYRNRDQIPALVCRQTGVFLDGYFGRIPGGDSPYTKEFFMRSTMGYINEAFQGFFTLADKTSRLQRHEVSALFEGMRTHSFEPDVESNEAFGVAKVVFGLMPSRFDGSEVLRMPASAAGPLYPPRTTIDTYLRLLEIEREVIKIIYGERSPDIHNEDDYSSLVRTYAFFKVAGEVPLAEPASNEIAVPEDTYRRLLDGINLDPTN